MYRFVTYQTFKDYHIAIYQDLHRNKPIIGVATTKEMAMNELLGNCLLRKIHLKKSTAALKPLKNDRH